MNEPAPITIKIPLSSDETDNLTVDLAPGEPLFVVGANGSGKSALLQFIYKNHLDPKTRWLRAIRSNLIMDDQPQASLTIESRKTVDQDIRQSLSADNTLWASIMEPLPQRRAFYDLIANHKNQAYEFSRWARDQTENISAKELNIKSRSIIADINDIFKQAAIPCEIEITGTDELRAQRLGGNPYHIRQLSDGERNAIFLVSEALTADQGSILLIDEPEQHLHRSIIVPLLSTLFAKRRDCWFVISTHELALPAASANARTIIVRNCNFDKDVCNSWDVDLLESDAGLPEELKIAILGSRRNILFVEGTEGAFDQSLYKLIYPDVSVVAVGGCGEVIRSVKGLGGVTTFHWVTAFGLIDRDDRTSKKIEQLKNDSIFALDVHSAEALYYCLEARTAAAQAQTGVKDVTVNTLLDVSKNAALEALAEEGIAERLVTNRCLRLIRNSVESIIPNMSDFSEKPDEEIEIKVKSPYAVELKKFEQLLADNELDKLIARYPVRNSKALHALAKGLRFDNRDDYEQAVLLQIKSNPTFRVQMLNKLSSLTDAISQTRTTS